MRGPFLLLFVMLLLGPEAALAQCAMCRDAAASSPVQTREALNYAIIGLALTPYLVAWIAVTLLFPGWRAFIRAAFRRPAQQPTRSQP